MSVRLPGPSCSLCLGGRSVTAPNPRTPSPPNTELPWGTWRLCLGSFPFSAVRPELGCDSESRPWAPWTRWGLPAAAAGLGYSPQPHPGAALGLKGFETVTPGLGQGSQRGPAASPGDLRAVLQAGLMPGPGQLCPAPVIPDGGQMFAAASRDRWPAREATRQDTALSSTPCPGFRAQEGGLVEPPRRSHGAESGSEMGSQ